MKMWWKRRPEAALGPAGERLAARYLRLRGYRILARNLMAGPHELDIVARRGDTIAFVEVKTRLRDDAAAPEDSVGETKQRHIRNAARHYLAQHQQPDTYYRFDVVSVVWPERGKAAVTHFPDAFR
jgi:putative endonuclease